MKSVYLDLVFFVNFLMDYLLLYFTSLFRHTKPKRGRRFAAAVCGALFACVSVLAASYSSFFRGFLKSIFTVCFVFACAAVITAVAYGTKKTAFLVNYITLLTVTFVMGGMIYSIGIACTRQWGKQETTLALSSAGLTVLTAITAFVLMLVRFFKNEQKKSLIYRVKLIFSGRELYCQGLMDTGNCLYEPFGGQPVVLLTDQAIIQTAKESLAEQPQKAKFVPFSSVGRQQGILEGMELPEIVIYIEEKEIRQEGIVVAFADFTPRRGEYQIILHPDLLPDLF